MGSTIEPGVLAGPAALTSLDSPGHAAPQLTIFQRLGAGGARMLVRVVGEIDMVTAPALADALELAQFAAVRMPALVEIEVDLRAVEFLGAAGLTELVRAHRRSGRAAVRLCVVARHPVVTRPLRLAGLDQLLGLRTDPDPSPPTGLAGISPSSASAGEQLSETAGRGRASRGVVRPRSSPPTAKRARETCPGDSQDG